MRPLLIVLLICSFVNIYIYAEDINYSKQAWQDKLAGKWTSARKNALLSEDPALIKLIAFEYYLAYQNHASFEEITDFIEKNKDWPKIEELKIAAENALNDKTKLNYVKILAWFKKHPPQTSNGYKYFLKCFGPKIKNHTEIVAKAWINSNFTKDEEKEFLKTYGKYLNYTSHIKKIDELIWKRNTSAAKEVIRFLKKEDTRLANIKIALLEKDSKAESMYQKLLEINKTQSLMLYCYLFYKTGENKISDKVAKLALRISNDKNHDKELSNLKNILARHLIEDKKYKLAYTIAKSYSTKDSTTISRLEFLCGFIALRYLKDTKLALEHFLKFKKNSTISISIAKANYWIGRCYKAAKNKELAKKYFEDATKLNFTFYGILALDELGHKTLFFEENKIAKKKYYDDRFKALNLLIKYETINEKNTQLKDFAIHMIRNTKDKSRIASIVKSLINTKKDHILIEAARIAALSKVFFVDYAFPKPIEIKEPIVNPLWTYGIIRQESSFHSHAINIEGRQDGIMQVIPITAKKTCASVREQYEQHKMRDDDDFSIKIGSCYLKFLSDYYKGSYVLATPAYNAGKNKIDSWLKRFGDPRKSKSLYEILDWMEQIPFPATRQYLQNVLENIQIYHYKLRDNNLVIPLYLLGKEPVINTKIISSPNIKKSNK